MGRYVSKQQSALPSGIPASKSPLCILAGKNHHDWISDALLDTPKRQVIFTAHERLSTWMRMPVTKIVDVATTFPEDAVHF